MYCVIRLYQWIRYDYASNSVKWFRTNPVEFVSVMFLGIIDSSITINYIDYIDLLIHTINYLDKIVLHRYFNTRLLPRSFIRNPDNDRTT